MIVKYKEYDLYDVRFPQNLVNDFSDLWEVLIVW